MAGTRSRRNQSRRERREQQRLERVAKRLAAQVARQTAEPRRTSRRRGGDEAARIAAQIEARVPSWGTGRAQTAAEQAENRERGIEIASERLAGQLANASPRQGIHDLTSLFDAFTGIPTAYHDPSLLNISLAATGAIMPGWGRALGTAGREVRAITRGLRELPVGATDELARAAGAGGGLAPPLPPREPPRLPGGRPEPSIPRRSRAGAGSRYIRYHEGMAQLPASPNRITRKAQALSDRLAESLADTADRLALSPSRTKRAAGKVITPVSARGRAPTAIGRLVGKEAGRRHAQVQREWTRLTHLRTLHRGGAQTAAILEAQLPSRLRGGQGLRQLRDRLRAETFRAGDPVTQRNRDILIGKIDDVLAHGGKANPRIVDDIATLMRDRERALLRAGVIKADEIVARRGLLARYIAEAVPRTVDADAAVIRLGVLRGPLAQAAGQVSDPGLRLALESQLDSIDTTLALAGSPPTGPNLPAVRGKAVEEAIYEGEYLDPERLLDEAAQVEDAVWRDISTEGAIYVGHRRLGSKGAQSAAPRALGTMGTRRPAGVGRSNQLISLRSGDLRTDIGVVLEDWSSAQRYEIVTQAKDMLAALGSPLGPEGRLSNHILVNPKGHRIPRRFTYNEYDELARAGHNPEELAVNDLTEYVANTFADTNNLQEAERLLRLAGETGTLADVRQVPVDVWRRFEKQLSEPILARGGDINTAVRALATSADVVQNLVGMSLIYGQPGYVPANLAANAIMAGLHQGPALIGNLPRALELLAGPVVTRDAAGLRLKDMILNEVGFGASAAIASPQTAQKVVGALRAPAKAAGHIADDPLRVASFLHEAGREGIISRAGPHLTGKEKQALIELFEQPEMRPILNDISQRGNKAMVDFTLGPTERRILRRIVFIYPWLKGASKYPIYFALNYPGRTAAMAAFMTRQVGGTGEEAEKARSVIAALAGVGGLREAPPWLQGALPVGEVEIGGRKFPRVLPTVALSPTGTMLDTLRTAVAAPGARRIGEYLHPALTAAVNVGLGQAPWGSDVGYAEAAKLAGERLTPNLGLVKDLISPPALEDAGIYPGDVTRAGRLQRSFRGVLPITGGFGYPVDPEEVRSAAIREGVIPSYPTDPALRTSGRGQGSTRTPRQTGEASERRVELSGYRTMPLQNAVEKIDEVFASLPEASRDRAKESLRVKYRIDAAIDETVAGKNGRYDYEKAAALMVDLIGEYRPDIAHYAEDAFDRISDVDQAKAFWDKGLELIREYYPWNEVAKGFSAWDKEHAQ
ncbi:MAG: hypothetical protein IT496_02340 [Gammaproteobacteria bacterium]|nr:hypothetical protein [Gammaproteobacteria bacterium]